MITKEMERTLLRALDEDLGSGDITSEAIFTNGLSADAEIIVEDRRLQEREGTLAGLEEAKFLLDYVGGITYKATIGDGEGIGWHERVLFLNGEIKKVLAVERTILNILSRMSGIATLTRWLQEDNGVRVAATRKSPPGLLSLDKKAVELGGGYPHRRGLYDRVLIKDNHINALMREGMGREEAIRRAIERCRGRGPLEIEVESRAEALWAASLGAEIILLDNFTPKEARVAVRELQPRGVKIELSGGVTAENIGDYAAAEPDWISVGALTHSARALDMSLELCASPAP